MGLRGPSWLALGAALLCTIGLVGSGSGCTQTGWNTEDKPCPPDLEEVKEERYSGQRIKTCCDPNDESFELTVKQMTQCQTTKCTAASSSTCDAIIERWVKGKKVDWEEILREPCTMEGNAPGFVGLCCAKGSAESMLASGLGAEPNEFPHQAKLILGESHCGGTVYNKRFIVTASYCVVAKKTRTVKTPDESWKVVLGSNIGDMESKEYVYGVKRVIEHEDYSKKKPHPELQAENPRTFNDIALLELDREIVFGPKVKALEIAPEGFDPLKYSDKAVIVGWGTTDTLELSSHLQKSNFIIRSDKACFENDPVVRYGPWYMFSDMTEQVLCVGGILDGKWSPTSGEADSGGPAICRGPDGKILLCGVTSFGGNDAKCAKGQDEKTCPPSVYAEVAYFNKWIKKHAGEQEGSSFHVYKPYLYGEPVPKGKYAHQVHITSQGGKPCGGTLLAPDSVVTAAQCVMSSDGTRLPGLQVKSGLNDLNGEGKTHQVNGLTSLSDFKRIGPPVDVAKQGNRILQTDNYHKNVLAIIKLDSAANIDPSQIPELSESTPTPTSGTELAFPRNTTRGGQLMSREFTFLSKGECQNRMNRMASAGININVDEYLLCGVEKYSGGSTCDRELGGGVICKGKNGKDTLCGVEVFRLCELSIPNGFMDMSLHRDWVKDTIKKL